MIPDTIETSDSESSNKGGKIFNPILLVSLSLLIILGFVLWFYQSQSTPEKFLEMFISAVATLITTFVGVLASFGLSSKFEEKKENKRRQNTYNSSLKLIASELDINQLAMANVLEGLKSMPRTLKQLHSNYQVIVEVASGAKTKAFYSLMSTSAFEEIGQRDDVFNSLQQAYYNMEMTTNGLALSQIVFKDYEVLPVLTQNMVNKANEMIEKETNKVVNTIGFIQIARELLISKLKKAGVTFSKPD